MPPPVDVVSIQIPTTPPQGFAVVEPGFFVRQDRLGKVENARAYVRSVKSRITLLTSELTRLAAKYSLGLSRKNPFGDFYSAVNSDARISTDDGERINQLLEEWQELKRVTPDGLPLRTYTPPSCILEILDVLERPGNILEGAFWWSAVESELMLSEDEVFDVPDNPGVVVIRLAYYPLIQAKLESWLSGSGMKEVLALHLLSANLVHTTPQYQETCNRVGLKAISDLRVSSDSAFKEEAVAFLRAHPTDQLRAYLFSEMEQRGSEGLLPVLCQALPAQLTVEEVTALAGILRSSESGDSRTSLVSVLNRQVGFLVSRCGKDRRAGALLESIDTYFLNSSEKVKATDAVAYSIARLNATGGELFPNRSQMVSNLESTIERATPGDRRSVAAQLGQLRSEDGMRLLDRLASDQDEQVAQVGILNLVEFAFRYKVAGSDTALARVLSSAPEDRVLPALKCLSGYTPPPSRVPQTIAALEKLAITSQTEEIRSMAAQACQRLRR